MHPILMQLMNNLIILVIALLLTAFLLKGFFWKYLRVKMSFGKLILVKVRAINRDHYKIGKAIEGFLVYSFDRSSVKRLVINDSGVFYRCMGVTWVDVDEEKNALVKSDFSAITGYDAVKISDLLKRALYKPQINELDKMLKAIIIMIVVVLLMLAAVIFLSYNMYNQISVLQQAITALQSKATIIPVTGL